MFTEFAGEVDLVADAVGRTGRKLTLGVTAPITVAAAASVKAAVDMDTLRRSLDAVDTSAGGTARRLAELKDIAELPDLSFRDAIEGDIRLQAIGFSAAESARTLRAFGNAIATTGGDSGALDRVVAQIRDITIEGRVLGNDLGAIIDTAPIVGRALQAAFGTVSPQEIQALELSTDEFFDRLLTALEDLPQAVRRAETSFEDFTDALFRARVRVGDNLLPGVTAGLDRVTAALDSVDDASPAMVKLGIAGAGAAAGAGPLFTIAGKALETGVFLGLAKQLTSTSKAFGALGTAVAVGGPLALGLAAVGVLGLTVASALKRASTETNKFNLAVARFKEAGDDLAGADKEALEAGLANLESKLQVATFTGVDFSGGEQRVADLDALRAQIAAVKAALALLDEPAGGGGGGGVPLPFKAGDLDPTIENITRVVERMGELRGELSGLEFEAAFATGDTLTKAQEEIALVRAELAALIATFNSFGALGDFEAPAINLATGPTDSQQFLRRQRIAFAPAAQGGGIRDRSGREPARESFGDFDKLLGLDKLTTPIKLTAKQVKAMGEEAAATAESVGGPFQQFIDRIANSSVGGGVLDTLGATFSPENLASGFATALASTALNAITGAIGGLFGGESPEERAERMAREQAADSLARLKRNLDEVSGALRGLSGGTIDQIGQAIEAGLEGPFDALFAFGRFETALDRFGISMGEVEALADSLDIEFRTSAEFLRELDRALAEIDLADFFRSPDGQGRLRDARAQLFDLEPLEILEAELAGFLGNVDLDDTGPLTEAIQQALEKFGIDNPSVEAAIAGLDLSSAAGLEGFEDALRELFAQFEAGALDLDQLGDLSADEFLNAILELDRLAESAADASEAVSKVGEELLNLPSGFKVSLARFRATDVGDGAGTFRDAVASGGTIITEGDTFIDQITVIQQPGEDGEELADRVVEKLRRLKTRGGTKSLTLGA
ncbi:MAG: tape measure protein [Gemmatimonadota bacterium]